MSDGTDGAGRDDETVIEAEVVEPAEGGMSSSAAGRRRAHRRWRARLAIALLVGGLLVWWGWPRIETMLPDGWRARLADGLLPHRPPPSSRRSGATDRAFAERLAALEREVAALREGSAGRVDEIVMARLRTLADRLSVLADRQAALESALHRLRQGRETAARQALDRELAVHLARLALRIDEGGALAGELAALRALAAAMSGSDRAVLGELIDTLSPLAVGGLVSREELAGRLDRLLAARTSARVAAVEADEEKPGMKDESRDKDGGLWQWLRERVRIERRRGGTDAGNAAPARSAPRDLTDAAIRLALTALRDGDEARAREALLTLGSDAPADALAVREALAARMKARAALLRTLDRLGNAGERNRIAKNPRDGAQP
ncbi:MAG: hypothetical protein D6757_03525 [Alphaproteobacteria bacterium]|nr:MAG: hypothetical protein D6757_03525 [Alphaproteobacteria bacterium]